MTTVQVQLALLSLVAGFLVGNHRPVELWKWPIGASETEITTRFGAPKERISVNLVGVGVDKILVYDHRTFSFRGNRCCQIDSPYGSYPCCP